MSNCNENDIIIIDNNQTNNVLILNSLGPSNENVNINQECNTQTTVVNNNTLLGDTIIISDANPKFDCIEIDNTQYTGFVVSVNGKTGIVFLTRADLGLENVDNTSDQNKPISSATLSALLLKTDLSKFLTLNSFITSNSLNWDSVYTIVNVNSAIWSSSNYGIDTGVRALTGFWDSSYTTVQANSSFWGGDNIIVNSSVVNVSDPIKFVFNGDGYTKNYTVSGVNGYTNPSLIEVFVENVRQEPYISYSLSANIVRFVEAPEIDTRIVVITPNNESYDVQDSTVRGLTGNWQSTYTTVKANSSNWLLVNVSDPIKFTFTGDGVTKNYTVNGTNNSNNASFIEVFVENVRQEPNISYTLLDDVVRFLEAPESETSIVIITPNNKLYNLYTDELSIPYFNVNNVTYDTELRLLSSFWDSVYTTVKVNSAEWESAYLDTIVLNQQVSNIQSNIITLDSSITTLANFANINTSVNSNSANWDSSYTTVNSNSANWNYQGSDIKALTGLWDTTYNTVENNSSNWSFAYNKVSNLTVYDIATLYDTLTGKQAKGNYPVLDNDNKIPAIYLPGFVDDILEYNTYSLFPIIGNVGKIYVSLDNGKAYRWGGTIYTEIVSSPGTTDSLAEGSVNKYFTNSRAASAAPVQSVAGRTGNIVLGINDITNLNTQLTATNVTTSTFQVKAVSQGVYNDGTTIPAGTSLETIIRNMLITRVFPTYNAPLLSVAYGSPAISTTYEVGFTIPTFTINPTYTPRDGGSLVGYAYFRNSSLLGNGSTFTVNSFQINSTTTLQVSARYNDGPIYNDNLGDPYPDTSIKAGSITNTITINTLYPYFYGKSSTQPTAASIAAEIQAGTATKVLADANGTVSIGYNANGEFIWFAHIGTTKTKWYFTELNSGNIGNGNFINTPVLQNVISPQGYWANTQYKIYISSGQTSTTGALQFRNL